MQVKLTLRLERQLIERAKHYAKQRGTSVSQMVADYFKALTTDDTASGKTDENWKQDLPPITRSLVGSLAGNTHDEDDYYRYLAEKHR